MTRSIDDGNVPVWSFKLGVSNIDRNTSFSLFLKPIHDPSELEGLTLFAHLLELLDDCLWNVPSIIKEPSDCRALSVVYVPDKHDVNVGLLLWHLESPPNFCLTLLLRRSFKTFGSRLPSAGNPPN
ncbi:125aa long hypothetical protein [Pyrococcus horikoshii OT3]|uniref:Uncharacterized protein n=1 Tax=Pyrococcus horikoshii (strain ATCC 700860 / DSM 12428 / JCM 9974 / NBRC 100139 / OT-3) TaxID=70601 RepID=O59155_PYRHO|nr:125aa long hypothetical protein [Pyrococcus horikoshii OT3]